MPINLKKKYGKRYRIDYDRYIDGSPVNIFDPQLMRLKSAIGHVYVHSDTHLGFATDGNRLSLKNHPNLQLVQDGDDGRNYIFECGKLEKLAKLLKLYVRKQVTEEERARLAAMSKGTQFSSRLQHPILATETRSD